MGNNAPKNNSKCIDIDINTLLHDFESVYKLSAISFYSGEPSSDSILEWMWDEEVGHHKEFPVFESFV